MMDRQQKIDKLNSKRLEKEKAEAKRLEDSSRVLEEAVNNLKKAFDVGVEVNGLDQLVDQIAEINTFKESVDELRDAIKAMPETVKVEDIDGIVGAIKSIEIKAPDIKMPETEKVDVIQLVASIISSINKLSKVIVENKTEQGQDPKDFIPYRRVIKVGNALIFDDLPHTTGGFGGGSSVPTIAGSVPVVNPDGSNISGGTVAITDARYAVIADDATTGGVVYVGYAAIGSATSAGVWRIKKIDTTNYPVTTWCDGNDNFDNVFDDRVSLTYS